MRTTARRRCVDDDAVHHIQYYLSWSSPHAHIESCIHDSNQRDSCAYITSGSHSYVCLFHPDTVFATLPTPFAGGDGARERAGAGHHAHQCDCRARCHERLLGAMRHLAMHLFYLDADVCVFVFPQYSGLLLRFLLTLYVSTTRSLRLSHGSLSLRQRMRRMPTWLAPKSLPPRSSSCSAPSSSSLRDDIIFVTQTNPNDSKHFRCWLFSFCPYILLHPTLSRALLRFTGVRPFCSRGLLVDFSPTRGNSTALVLPHLPPQQHANLLMQHT
jgi:hypothetical protein